MIYNFMYVFCLLLGTQDVYVQFESFTDSRLYIKNLHPKHSGLYRCSSGPLVAQLDLQLSGRVRKTIWGP